MRPGGNDLNPARKKHGNLSSSVVGKVAENLPERDLLSVDS